MKILLVIPVHVSSGRGMINLDEGAMEGISFEDQKKKQLKKSKHNLRDWWMAIR